MVLFPVNVWAAVPSRVLESLRGGEAVVIRRALDPNLVLNTHAAAQEAFANPAAHLERRRYSSVTKTGYVSPAEPMPGAYPNSMLHYVDYQSGIGLLYPEERLLAKLHAGLGALVGGFAAFLKSSVRLPEIQAERSVLRVAKLLNDFVNTRIVLASHLGHEYGPLSVFVGGPSHCLQVLQRDRGWVTIDAEAGDVVIGAGMEFSRYCRTAEPAKFRVVAGSPFGTVISYRAEMPSDVGYAGRLHSAPTVRFAP